jgi:cobalt-zinc-cadmium efflux system outer membrane protein
LVAIAAVTTAHAQAPAGTGERFLRLEELERLATERNPTIDQADAIARAVSGRQRQARLYPNPIVGYSADDITTREPNRGKHLFWVQQSIITGSKRALVQRAIAQEAVHAEAEQAMQRQRVLNAVRMGFYEVLGAARIVEVRRELARLAREAVDVSEDLYNIGQADRPDVLEVTIEAERAEIDRARAESDLERAWRELAAIVGQPDMPYTALAGDLEAELPLVDEAAVREQILRESPELRVARARAEHAMASLARARADRLPNFFVRGAADFRPQSGHHRPGRSAGASRRGRATTHGIEPAEPARRGPP